MNRFVLYLILAITALVAGCANPTAARLGGQAGYYGRHGGITVGAEEIIVPGRQAQAGVPIYGTAGNPYPAEACPAGYRQINGVYRCMGEVIEGGYVVQGGQRISVPSKCDFGDGVIAYTYEGRAGCDKIAAKMAQSVVRAPQATSATVADNRPPAYCPIYGPGGQKKNVLNPERREAYCGEVVRDLQARKIAWSELKTVD